MMLAAKHFDPILGIDVHIIQPPGPVPPVPIPHPFIGMVIDPFDYVPILGATVMVNGIPRGQAGTAGKCVPSHIPIGGTFIKPPGNEAEIFMGSSTVAVDGDAFSYLALPSLTCQDVGMPPPPRAKKKSKTKSLVLPTSVVLPIPAGPPVLVGGAPTISLMAMGMKVGMAGLGKAFKKLSKTKAFKKVRSKIDNIKKKFKKKKKGKAASNRGSCEGGCPVDAITGAAVERLEDYHLPGPIPFVWKRYYDSRWTEIDSPVGCGWRHAYQRTLEPTNDGFLFTDDNGEEFELPPIDPESGFSIWAGFELSRITAGTYRVRRRGSPVMEFDLRASEGPAKLAWMYKGSDRVNFSYDRQGRLTNIKFSDGRLVHLSYDEYNHILALVVPVANDDERDIVRYEYDINGVLAKHIDALEHATSFEYDHAKRLICYRNPLGYAIYYAYNDKGQCIRTWGQDGLYDEHFEYQPELNQSIRRSSTGAEWIFVYDDNGTAIEIVDPYGESRKFILNDFGRVVVDVDEIGQETHLLYDQWGGHYGRRTPLGDFQPPRNVNMHSPERPLLRLPRTPLEWFWGGVLRPEQIDSSFIGKTRKNESSALEVRDAMGRVLEKTDEQGQTEKWTYDTSGNIIEYIDVEGSAHRTEIGSWNLPVRKIEPTGASIAYEYNIHEYVTKIVDPNNSVSEYTYDLKDRIVEVRRHGATKERYTWDGAGNLIEKRDGDGRPLLELEVGLGGLPVKRKLASGQTHEFEYNENGYVTRATTNNSETIFIRDDWGRALQDQRDGISVEHSFGLGRLTESVMFKKFQTKFDYQSNRLIQITDPTGQKHTLQSFNDGRIKRQLANGVSETCRFNGEGKLLERKVVRPNAPSEEINFHYSPSGNLVERTDPYGSTHWEYDASHRLVKEVSREGYVNRYERDLAGNLLAKPDLNNVRITEGNRIQAANGDTFTYNSRNHITSRIGNGKEIHYEYDSKDMLVGALINGKKWEAEYDPLGRRIRKTYNNKTTEYYWDDNRLAAEVRPDGSCRIYIFMDIESLVPFLFVDYDSVDTDPDSGLAYYLFTDQRGCPEWVENNDGRGVWHADVDPYGSATIGQTNEIELNLRMPGHYADSETGLHYNRFRYYSPELGRYLQSDPIGQSGGINLYTYCQNPLIEVDLLGWNHSNDVSGSKKTGDAESPEIREPIPIKRSKLDEARQKQRQASEIHKEVSEKDGTLRNKTVAVNGGEHISGYDVHGKATPDGFSSKGRNVDEALAQDKALKNNDGTDYKSPANSSIDPKRTKDGKIVGSKKDGDTIEGGAAATHAERQSVTTQNMDETNDTIGVSKEQCGDCRTQQQVHAKNPDRPGYPEPVVVADPEHTRVYNSDSSVDVYDKNNEHVYSAPTNESPSATRNNYKGIPW